MACSFTHEKASPDHVCGERRLGLTLVGQTAKSRWCLFDCDGLVLETFGGTGLRGLHHRGAGRAGRRSARARPRRTAHDAAPPRSVRYRPWSPRRSRRTASRSVRSPRRCWGEGTRPRDAPASRTTTSGSCRRIQAGGARSGPFGAARLLVEVGDITRLPNKDHFGSCPVDRPGPPAWPPPASTS